MKISSNKLQYLLEGYAATDRVKKAQNGQPPRQNMNLSGEVTKRRVFEKTQDELLKKLVRKNATPSKK